MKVPWQVLSNRPHKALQSHRKLFEASNVKKATADKMWGLILSRAAWVRRKNLVLFCRPGQCEFITKLPPPFLAAFPFN